MSDESRSAAPGWYPSPEGGQRYWDGQQWLALPDPGSPRVSGAETPGSQSRISAILRFVKRPLVLGILAVLVVAGIGSAIAVKVSNDSKAEEQRQAIAAAAQEEADRAAEAAAAKQREDDAERAQRSLTVIELEASVKTMAEEHVSKSIIDGPILNVSCDPVGGGSTDDLTETTTVFECFAANEDVGDGRMRGFKYHATMNWTAGTYTYGFGAP